MKKSKTVMIAFALMFCIPLSLGVFAAPEMINYQGKVEADGVPFNGLGAFRFALMDETGTIQYWSNDGVEPPDIDIPVSVTDGLYNVILGSTNGMDPIPASVFDNEPLYLRVWFNDGINDLQLLTPDQRLTSAGYAFQADYAKDADTVDSMHYSSNWETTQGNIQTALSGDFHNIGGTDDDQPDDDSEVPDDISIDNGRLYAPFGVGNVGIGTASPREALDVDGKVQVVDGVMVDAASGIGVYVESAGAPTETSTVSENSGFQVAGAEGCGLRVGYTDSAGVFVDKSYGDGFHIYAAGNPSQSIYTTVPNGFEVAGTGGNGLFVGRADQDGIQMQSIGQTGITIGSAAEYGISISYADVGGVNIFQVGNPSYAYGSTSGLDGYAISGAEGHGMFVGLADKSGVYVYTAAEGGFHVEKAGSPTDYQLSTESNGFEVSGSEGHGMYVGHTDMDGLHVHNAEGMGVNVQEAGSYGVYVAEGAGGGMHVFYAGTPTNMQLSFTADGFAVYGAQGNGVYVGHSDLDGVYVHSAFGDGVQVSNASGNGVHVYSADLNGVNVNSSSGDGLHVVTAGTPSTTYTSGLPNGLEIEGAQNHGIYLGHADTDGIQINSAADDGLYVTTAGDDGVAVSNAGGMGVYAHTTATNNEWGVYTPDKIYAGVSVNTKRFCTYGKNIGSADLDSGDLVCIADGFEENVLGQDDSPLMHITKASDENAGAVIGVVEYKVRIHEKLEESSAVRKSFCFDPGKILNGDYCSIIIIGPADVKCEAHQLIKPGDTLTAGGEGAARKVRTRDLDGILVAENVGTIGKAMEHSEGTGKLKVFVNCN